MDPAEQDVLAFTFPRAHQLQIHSTNPLERLRPRSSGEPTWWAYFHVVGIFPNERAIIRLVGAMIIEQNVK